LLQRALPSPGRRHLKPSPMLGIVIFNPPRPLSTSSPVAARGFVLTPKIAIDWRSKLQATRRIMIIVAKAVKTMSRER
jgi:hypothetical protein